MVPFRKVFAALLTLGALSGASVSAQMIDTPASHAVIMDHTTGKILYSKRGDEPMTPPR